MPQPPALRITQSTTYERPKNQSHRDVDNELLLGTLDDVLTTRLRQLIAKDAGTLEKDVMRNVLLTRKSIPYGTMNIVQHHINQDGHNLSTQQIYDLYKTRHIKPIDRWKAIVEQRFEEVFHEEQKAFLTTNQDEDEDEEDEEEDEEDEDENEDTRSTPPIGMQKLLREDLEEQGCMIARLREVAEIVTTSLSDVSAVMRASIYGLGVKEFRLQNNAITITNTTNTFTFSDVLPQAYQLKDHTHIVDGVIYAAKVNCQLANLDSVNNPAIADINQLYTFHHLSFIFTRISKEGIRNESHPVWNSIQPRLKMDHVDTTRLSNTIYSAIRTLAVNFANMWSNASIFKKSLDSLLQALLTINLKEKANKEKPQKTARLPTRRERDQKKQTKARIKHEQKEMAKHIRIAVEYPVTNTKSKQRIASCMRRLCRLSDTTKDQEMVDATEMTEGLEKLDISSSSSLMCIDEDKNEGVQQDDDIYEEDEEDVEDEEINNEGTDPNSSNQSTASAKRIRALKAVVKRILESDEIHQAASESDVDTFILEHTKKLEKHEASVVTSISKAILPFIPTKSTSCFITQIPLVVLANKILISIGFDNCIELVCPDVKPSSIHALSLNAKMLYEILTPHQNGYPIGPYQVVRAHADGQTSAITSVEAARKEKDAMIWSFFDRRAVEGLLSSYNMEELRLVVFTVDGTVRFVGKMDTSHPPIFSAYEKREKKKRPEKIDMQDDQSMRDQLEELEENADQQHRMLEEKHAQMRTLSTLVNRLDTLFNAASGKKKMAMGVTRKWFKRKFQDEHHESLLLRRQWKNTRNEIWRIRNGKAMAIHPPHARKVVRPDKPFYEDTGDRFIFEGPQQIAFGGVDYGHCVMASMVPVTKDEVERAVSNYNHPEHQIHDHPPKPHNTTSEELNYLTGHLKMRAKMNKNKKGEVKEAERELADLKFATTFDPDAIIRKQQQRVALAPTLRRYYYSPRIMKQRRHKALRQRHVYSQVCKDERRYVKQHCKVHKPSSTRPIMCIGLAGTGVGSRLKGRNRRGGLWHRKHHLQAGPTIVQDEFRTSQTCMTCFSPLVKMPATIIKDGKRKRTTVHGALMCINRECSSYKKGTNTFSRDALSARAIAVNAATMMFSKDKRPFPPFDPIHPNKDRIIELK